MANLNDYSKPSTKVDAIKNEYTDLDLLFIANPISGDVTTKKDADAVFANGQKGICHWTSVKFTEFCTKLPNSTAVALAELLWGIFTTEFDIQFMAHAELHHDGGHADFDSLSKLLRGPDADSLTTAFKKYTAASAAQAVICQFVALGAPSHPLPSAPFRPLRSSSSPCLLVVPRAHTHTRARARLWLPCLWPEWSAV